MNRQTRIWFALIAFVLLLLVGWLVVPAPVFRQADPQPAPTYADALARFDEVKAAEDALDLQELCPSQLLLHDGPTDEVVVLFHGYRNCPAQFGKLGEQLHAAGYNVLIPRMPAMGLADPFDPAQIDLTAADLIDHVGDSIDIAAGLGEEVTAAGLSAGGLLAAWAAQNREEVDTAILIAPFLAPNAIPPAMARPAARVFGLLPNRYLWQDPELQADVPNPPYVYPRNATRPLAELMGLGFAVRRAAQADAPFADAVLVITNASDEVVDRTAYETLLAAWQDQEIPITRFEFPAELELDHDIVDPLHPKQQVEVVYPTLVPLVEEAIGKTERDAN